MAESQAMPRLFGIEERFLKRSNLIPSETLTKFVDRTLAGDEPSVFKLMGFASNNLEPGIVLSLLNCVGFCEHT
jgi:hypothetical protein